MVKSRNFLMGLGAGFLIISVILIFHDENRGITYHWTIDELKKISLEEGYKLYTEDELNQVTIEYEQRLAECQNQKNIKEKEQEIVFEIHKGMDTYSVALYLEGIGVIQEKNLFIEQLNDKKLTRKIKAGTFTYVPTMTMDNLIEMITSGK